MRILPRIMLVEDNPGDARLIAEALRDADFPCEMDHVTDGVVALERLRRCERPDIIVLDLNLPRMSGHELLGEIKRDRNTCSIPVIVFSTSQAEVDITRSYELQASCFVVKPLDLDDYFRTIQNVVRFWCETASLPPQRYCVA